MRQTALDYEGRILLAACDDGTIWRYDRRPAEDEADNGEPEADSDLHDSTNESVQIL